MGWFFNNPAAWVPTLLTALVGAIGYLLKTYVFVPKKKEAAPKLEDTKPQLSSEQMKSQLKPQFFTPEVRNMNQRLRETSTEPAIKLSPTAKVETISQSITNWAIPQEDAPPTKTCLVTRIRPSKFVETKPSPNEIAQYVIRLTPHQKRHEPVKNYDGIEISWRSWFTTIGLPFFDNPDTTAFFNPYEPGQMIDDLKFICHFNIADAPRFRTIHRGTPVGISGTIEEVNAVLLQVTIKKPHFFFFD
jgi:hypothetical protein